MRSREVAESAGHDVPDEMEEAASTAKRDGDANKGPGAAATTGSGRQEIMLARPGQTLSAPPLYSTIGTRLTLFVRSYTLRKASRFGGTPACPHTSSEATIT